MKVLIACEFSGIVRDAFARRGHDAWSCDLLPTESPGQHIQGDVMGVIYDGWDLMVAHPPCTFLTYAGMAHWNKPGREEKRIAAMELFMLMYNAPVHKVCVENPFGWPCQQFRKPSQVINPFDFGEPIRKRTCLWLRGLPMLMTSDTLWGDGVSQKAVAAPEPVYVGTRKSTGKSKNRYTQDVRPRNWHHTEAMGVKGLDRAHERSRSFKSIAEAMAEQWGDC